MILAGLGSQGDTSEGQKEALFVSEAFYFRSPRSLICIISLQDLSPFLLAHEWLTQRKERDYFEVFEKVLKDKKKGGMELKRLCVSIKFT